MESILINLKKGYRQRFRNIKLRACKVLYSFSANQVTNENRKTHASIGMYKKLNRVIENKKGIPSESKESPFLLLPIIRRYVNY